MIEIKQYSGLIRNYRALAQELDVTIDGCSRSEREERIILAAWQKWHEQLGAHINGQFSIILFDHETDTLFGTRDPLGAELLFYYQTVDGNLLVANQISEFFDKAGFVRELNEDMIQFFLAFNYVPGEETLFKGVFKVEPGGYLLKKNSSFELGRYWELSYDPDKTKTVDEWADEIERAMEDSLRDICDEGERCNSFLSGGVDSSYIVAKSKAECAYCVTYENQQASEEDEARQTAQYLGCNFEGIKVSPEEFLANIDSFLLAYEQPSADPAGLSLFSACKRLAPNAGIVFSGEGADEFFAGYSAYRNTLRLKINFDPVYYGSTYIMAPVEQRRFLKKYSAHKSTKDFMKQRCGAAKKYDMITWMLYSEMRSYFEASILFNSAQIARGTGLDIRMPFCDLRMFEVARRMPSRFKASKEGNKIALRLAASRVLPHEVAYRRKLGFPVPVRSWLANPAYNADIHRAFSSKTAHEFFNVAEIEGLLDALEGKTPRVGHRIWFKRHTHIVWRYVWTIYLFIRWYELFFVEKQV